MHLSITKFLENSSLPPYRGFERGPSWRDQEFLSSTSADLSRIQFMPTFVRLEVILRGSTRQHEAARGSKLYYEAAHASAVDQSPIKLRFIKYM